MFMFMCYGSCRWFATSWEKRHCIARWLSTMFGWTFEKLLPVWDRGDLCCYVFCSAWGRVDPCCCVWGRVDLCCCVQLEVGETSVGRVQFGWGRGERFGWSEVRSDGLTEVGVTSVRSGWSLQRLGDLCGGWENFCCLSLKYDQL